MNQHRKEKERRKRQRKARIERAREKLLAEDGEVAYGIVDTEYKDGILWMGNDKGPFKFKDETAARAMAMTIGHSLGWPTTRCRARVYDVKADHLKDSFDMQMPLEKALEDLESGRVI